MANIFSAFAFGSVASLPATTSAGSSSTATTSTTSKPRPPAAPRRFHSLPLATNAERLAELNLIGRLRSHLPRQTVDEFHSFLLGLRGEIGRYWALIACLLSVQCRDVVALAAARALIARCPGGALDVIAICAAPTSFSGEEDDGATHPSAELEKLVGSCNFYKTKAKNILRVTKELVEQTRTRALLRGRPRRQCEAEDANAAACRVPSDYKSLIALPGVGPKIAHLMRSVAFGVDETGIVVDTHVAKIATRLRWVPPRPRGGAEGIRKSLEVWVPRGEWTAFTLSVVGFGQFVASGIGGKGKGSGAKAPSSAAMWSGSGERPVKRAKVGSGDADAPVPEWARTLRAFVAKGDAEEEAEDIDAEAKAKAKEGATASTYFGTSSIVSVAAPAASCSEEAPLSSYERAREERLKRNKAFLAKIGLDSGGGGVSAASRRGNASVKLENSAARDRGDEIEERDSAVAERIITKLLTPI